MDYIAEAIKLVNQIASLDEEMLAEEGPELIEWANRIRDARWERHQRALASYAE